MNCETHASFYVMCLPNYRFFDHTKCCQIINILPCVVDCHFPGETIHNSIESLSSNSSPNYNRRRSSVSFSIGSSEVVGVRLLECYTVQQQVFNGSGLRYLKLIHYVFPWKKKLKILFLNVPLNCDSKPNPSKWIFCLNIVVCTFILRRNFHKYHFLLCYPKQPCILNISCLSVTHIQEKFEICYVQII